MIIIRESLVLELFEILLCPLVERVLVALCALYADAKEGVSETECFFLRFADVSASPVKRH